MRVAIATCREMPEPDLDQEPLLEALAGAGIDAELLAWDDPAADPGAFDACILRSTWNYHEQPQQFLDWAEETSRRTRLLNPLDVVQWNVHKRYLLELESRGVPIVPTALVSRGSRIRLGELMEARGWEDVVVKPAISAGSFCTRRFRATEVDSGKPDGGELFLRELVADMDALVQRFEPSVADGGERALVWIDGEFTHAVTKEPRFVGDEEQVSASQLLGEEERALAEALIEPWSERLFYGRVDLISGPDGRPLLSELEFLEPSLFLLQEPRALQRLVESIGRLAG